MALKHKPQASLLAASDSSSINQILTANGNTTDVTVFRKIGNNQQVSVTVLGLNSDNVTPSSATDYEVDLERSLDAGDSWVVHKTFNGPASEDVPYPNGAVLWRFRLVAKGAANRVRIQAIA